MLCMFNAHWVPLDKTRSFFLRRLMKQDKAGQKKVLLLKLSLTYF